MRIPFSRWLNRLPHWRLPRPHFLLQLFGASIVVTLALVVILFLQEKGKLLEVENTQLKDQVNRIIAELNRVRHEDQYVKNAQLSEEINHIEKTYQQLVATYEALLDLKTLTKDTAKLESQLAENLNLLSQRSWATASGNLSQLSQAIAQAKEKIAATFVIPANVPESTNPPAAGFSRQSVKTDIGTYLVDMVAADMGSTRIIVDTASEGTCRNDCPTLALGEYVGRNGAFAGVNGSYFCPAEYPSCADKKGSFDTLLMNKNKVYFNSDNNVYSTVPAVIFLNGSMRFVGRSLEWGRDTSPDGVIANQPLLLAGGNLTFGGDDDPKKGSKGNRSFVGNRGTTAYIGVVHMATVAEVAHVLKALGLENGLNLDNGGSTALWYQGYKVGPGRNLPNAILFVRE